MIVVNNFLTLLTFVLLIFSDPTVIVSGEEGNVTTPKGRDDNHTTFSTLDLHFVHEITTTTTSTTMEPEDEKPKIPPYLWIIIIAIVFGVLFSIVASLIIFCIRRKQRLARKKHQRKLRPSPRSMESVMTSNLDTFNSKTTTLAPSTSKETTQGPTSVESVVQPPKKSKKGKYLPFGEDAGEKKRSTSKETLKSAENMISSDTIGSLNLKPVPPPKGFGSFDPELEKTAVESMSNVFSINGGSTKHDSIAELDVTQKEEELEPVKSVAAAPKSIASVTGGVTTTGSSGKETKTVSSMDSVSKQTEDTTTTHTITSQRLDPGK